MYIYLPGVTGVNGKMVITIVLVGGVHTGETTHLS